MVAKHNTHKVCVTLNGKPQILGDKARVSGLDIWQEKYLERLRNIGLDLIELYYDWASENKLEKLDSHRYILHLNKRNITFYMQREGAAQGLIYPKDSQNIEEALLALFEKEKIAAIILISWISSGMIIWQTCLRFGRPVFFIPTEHTAVCHLGFFLNPLGTACTGPDSGMKCSNCTHGVEPFISPLRSKGPWYSRRFQTYFRVTSWLPRNLQKPTIWALAELFQARNAVLSKSQGVARLNSAKRFLQSDNVTVLFQSPHQHQLFERAINDQIKTRTSLVIPANRDLSYEFAKDIRPLLTGQGRIVFLFAARSNFDRGLHFLLSAWGKLERFKNILTLIVRCDRPRGGVINQLIKLKEEGFDIDIAYGKLDDEQFVQLHRRVHFVVNPAVWEEPLAGSVIEGFDLGTPAIVPTRTGSSCFVESGQNGYTYEFRDMVSFLKCIEAAIQNIDSWSQLRNGALATSKKYRLLSSLQMEYLRSRIYSVSMLNISYNK